MNPNDALNDKVKKSMGALAMQVLMLETALEATSAENETLQKQIAEMTVKLRRKRRVRK